MDASRRVALDLAGATAYAAGMRRALLACLCLPALACGTMHGPVMGLHAGGPRTLEYIEELENRRSLGLGDLPVLARMSKDPEVRARAMLAMGRIQDPEVASVLVDGLTDPHPEVRAEAAFAIGLLGFSTPPLAEAVRDQLVTGVLEAEASEPDFDVRGYLFHALGRLGGPQAVARLVRALDERRDLPAVAALGLGLAARAKTPLPREAVEKLAGFRFHEMTDVRLYAAWALAQLQKPEARERLLPFAADVDEQVRAIAAKGLVEIATPDDVPLLARLLDEDEARVAAEATRALARLARMCAGEPCPALDALGGLSKRAARVVAGATRDGAPPLLALAQHHGAPGFRPLLKKLRADLAPGLASAAPLVKKDAANLDCRLAAALDRLDGTLAETLACGHDEWPEPWRVALGLNELATGELADPARRFAVAGPYLARPESQVRLAAIHALTDAKAPGVAEAVEKLLRSKDLVVAAAAADLLARQGDWASTPSVIALAERPSLPEDVMPTVAEALALLEARSATPLLEKWLGHPNVTVRTAAAEALTKLKGHPVKARRVELGEAEDTEPLDEGTTLVFETPKGEIAVKLDIEDAPRTSAHMAKLAREGFFDGLSFHRVVPDFVAQGGDPRGDGEGGPGSSIRCELNATPYFRGVVGMALAGKDTGGSQFFFTLSDQPHLDGRYTAFGVITRGLSVADSLLEGDRITRVHVVEP